MLAPLCAILLVFDLPLPMYLQTAGSTLGGEVASASILGGVLRAITAVILFSVFVVLVKWVGNFFKFRLTKVVVSKLPKIPSGRLSVFRNVFTWLGVLINVAYFAVAAAALYLCVTYILGCFAYTQLWSRTLEGGIEALLLRLGKTILHGIPGLFAVAVIAFIAKSLTHLINIVFKSVERGELALPWIYQDTAAPTRRIVVALMWIFAVVVAYPYVPGNESVAFKSIGVFVGLLVSLGSAGVMSQAMNGLAITFGRSFKPGDYVKIGAVEGTISEVTLVFTKLHTIRNEEIIVPNSVVATQSTYNYTRIADERGIGISTSVTFGYDVPWRQVHAILMLATEKTNGVSVDPAPYIIQTAFSNTHTEYTLVVHTKEKPELMHFVESELRQNIQDTFSLHGVSMMLPTYIDTQVPDAVPVERWFAEPAKDGD